jgi:hypothetical protein
MVAGSLSKYDVPPETGAAKPAELDESAGMLPVPAASETLPGVVLLDVIEAQVSAPAPSVEHPVSTVASAAPLPTITANAVKAPDVCVTVPLPEGV